MVQKKKTTKKTVKKAVKKTTVKQTMPAKKPTTAVQVAVHPVPTKVNTKRERNYPVISFILFIVALVIWFFVGRQFMIMAVDENLCSIRYDAKIDKSGPVVAYIDGQAIYLSEIQSFAASIPQLKDLPLDSIYPQLLETFVNSRMLRKAAEESKIEEKPVVAQAIRDAQDQIIAQAYLDEQLKARVTDERLNELYQSEMAHFKPAEEVRARHILVNTKSKAEDIIVKLEAGVPFGTLANQYSLDKSSPDGDLGYFTKEMMIPEFAVAVFALKKNQISEPIKTPFGWHVVQLMDRRQSAQPSFDDVKNDLRQMLMEQDLAEVIQLHRKKMNVKIQKPTL